MNFKETIQKIWFIVGFFFLFQILSLIGYAFPFLLNVFCILIIALAVIFSLIKIEYGFLFLFFEFFFGLQGHLFEFFGLSLRFGLFAVLMAVWLMKKYQEKQLLKSLKSFFDTSIGAILFIFLFIIFLGFLQGLLKQEVTLAIKDFINYSYFLLIFPLLEIFKNNFFIKTSLKLSQGFIIGISILTIIIFILFSSGLAEVHNWFYWWWRGVAIGKATDAGGNFFRIMSPAHLLVLPLFLVLLSFLIEGKKKLNKKIKKLLLFLSFLSGLVLIINFSRVYLLGVFLGLFILLKGVNWKRWLMFSGLTIFSLFLGFIILFSATSGGKFFQAFDFFQNRLKTVVEPETEISSLTRMNILPQLIKEIKKDPLFGQGLGSTISYYNQTTMQTETTYHLDWGYLEIWRELGLFGLITYGLLLFYFFYSSWQKLKEFKNDYFQKRLIIGLNAGLLSLMVANLTAPVLFHSLGIFYLISSFCLIFNLKKDETKIDSSNCYLE